jgi:carboxyl-terminal processing protease
MKKVSPLRAAGFVAAGLVTASVVAVVASGAAVGPSKSNLTLIGSVMQLIQQDYVQPVDADHLTEDALKGLLSHLDPHSSYMTEQEFRESQDDFNGAFGGIGVEISEQSAIPVVVSPIDGTPAAKAGLQPGDLIISIDGQSTNGMDPTQVVTAIRGKPGSEVTLSISRGVQKPFDVTLNRSIIHLHTITSKLEPGGIGYLRVSEFAGDTQKDLKQTIAKLDQDAGGGLKGLVLDLRDDPGGLLTAAVDVSGDFLNGGTVVSIHGRRSNDDQVYKARPNGDLLHGAPIVVLINGASASASEIVAGALQDQHRATVMGTQSFGKGSVQSIIPLNGNGALRLTTALYYTPTGRSIQGEGISPDILTEAPSDERVASTVMLRESELHGAFTNPGALGESNTQHPAGKPAPSKPAYSAPIKSELIGTSQDAQLNAALDFLKADNQRTKLNGAGRGD